MNVAWSCNRIKIFLEHITDIRNSKFKILNSKSVMGAYYLH